MNEDALPVLLSTAVGIAFLHTLIGVDHSLPFVVLGKAQRWTTRRVMAVTALCGAAHVLGSIALGAVGIGLGVAAERLEWIQELRGEAAAWLLIGFGLIYAAWGVVRHARGTTHSHWHDHLSGLKHDHQHGHQGEHLHPHGAAAQAETHGHRVERRLVTTWTLFIVFAFGPCEALIPLLMAPAWAHHWSAVVAVGAVFGLVTIGTMLGVVWLAWRGLHSRLLERVDITRWADTLAGLAIAGSGGAIKLLGI